MNSELIKQLMTHAGFDPAAIERMGVMPNAEKFAELIVRECLTFVEPMPGSGDIDDLALQGAYNGIKEHFGVEEWANSTK